MSTEINQTASNYTKKNLNSCELKISEYDGEALDFFLEPACGKLLRRINRKENSHHEKEFYDSLRSMAFFLRSSVNTVRKNLKKLEEIGLVSTRVGLLGGNRMTYWDVDRRNLNNFIFLAKKYYRTIKFKLGEPWVVECFEGLKKEMLDAVQNALVLGEGIKNNAVDGGVSKLTQPCIKIHTHTKDIIIKEKKERTPDRACQAPGDSSRPVGLPSAERGSRPAPPPPAQETTIQESHPTLSFPCPFPPSSDPIQLECEERLKREWRGMLYLHYYEPMNFHPKAIDTTYKLLNNPLNRSEISQAIRLNPGRQIVAEMVHNETLGILDPLKPKYAKYALDQMAEGKFQMHSYFKNAKGRLLDYYNQHWVRAKIVDQALQGNLPPEGSFAMVAWRKMKSDNDKVVVA